MIALDTNCLTGGADGCLDHEQARWLEQRLAEVHAVYRAADGGEVRTGADNRLVVIFSHHGIGTLTNMAGHTGPGGEPALGGGEVEALLHRFPNVVLWLNGHTHVNAIVPRPVPGAGTGAAGAGFWEVTTCAIIDWPCQTRLVELTDAGDYLSMTCTMLDHDAPAMVAQARTVTELAALHRELAANVPFAGLTGPGAGIESDRNVELRLPAPFALKELPGR